MTRVHVPLYADGPAEEDGWFGVIVRAGTGVVYHQQHGGTACLQGEVEGYYVPVDTWDPVADRRALRELRHIFERELGGAGLPAGGPRPELLERLRSTVGTVVFWTSEHDAAEASRLEIDDDRVGELNEAWIPVRTAAGPGVLVWPNSD